ncbi:MAG TPA: hypothetical protein VGI19_04285 [Candidatus Cybelea sp.]|jgi:hypothetical protein
MKLLAKRALFTSAGAILLGSSLGLSSIHAVSGATPAQSDKPDVSCRKPTACFTGTNSGFGAGIEGITHGSTNPKRYDLGAVEGGADGGENGVYAYSANRDGGFFENGTKKYYSLFADADNSDQYPFGAQNKANGTYFYVDYAGDGVFTGNVYATGYYTTLRTRGGQAQVAFNAQSTRASIEDTGTGRLMNGEGAVRFDEAFAQTVDLRQGYQVFLTPDGETRGLYVSGKYGAGFVVRETERGRSSLYFDYRVVAHPIGASPDRLPEIHLATMSKTNPGEIVP